MKQKKDLNTILATIRQVRTGEHSSSKLYKNDILETSPMYERKNDTPLSSRATESQWANIVDSDDSQTDDYEADTYSDNRAHSPLSKDGLRSAKANEQTKLDAFLLQRHMQTHQQKFTELDLTALRCLDDALSEEVPEADDICSSNPESKMNAYPLTVNNNGEENTGSVECREIEAFKRQSPPYRTSPNVKKIKTPSLINPVLNVQATNQSDMQFDTQSELQSDTEFNPSSYILSTPSSVSRVEQQVQPPNESYAHCQKEPRENLKEKHTNDPIVATIKHSSTNLKQDNDILRREVSEGTQHQQHETVSHLCQPVKEVQFSASKNTSCDDTAHVFEMPQHLVDTFKTKFGQDCLLFYLLDVHEDSTRLFLYGKRLDLESLHTHSCCIVVQEVYRNVFFYPIVAPDTNDDGSFKDESASHIAEEVNDELSAIRKRLGIKRWMFRPVKRGLFLNIPNVPNNGSAMFVKCVYSSKFPPLPTDLKGKTFITYFGAETTLTELFLIKRRIFGPSWLIVRNSKEITDRGARTSYCRYEHHVEGLHDIVCAEKTAGIDNAFLAPPPQRILSFSLQTSFSDEEKLEKCITVAAFGITWRTVKDLDAIDDCVAMNLPQVYGIARPAHLPMWPYDWKIAASKQGILLFDNDYTLISHFLDTIHEVDPDIILGHGITGTPLSILGQRLQHHQLKKWDVLSRHRRSLPLLKRTVARASKISGDLSLTRFLTLGRIVCDTELQARDILRQQPTFDLASLVKVITPEYSCPDLHLPTDVPKTFTNKEDAFTLPKNCLSIATNALNMESKLQILSLTRELTTIAGNLWNRSLLNFRAERNELLLLHQFQKEKLIKPEPRSFAKQTSRSIDDNSNTSVDATLQVGKTKAGYIGGLVLEPRSGLYDRFVLLLDFNSLYPSIIREYNICFTTVHENTESITANKRGVLPSVLEHLIERRKHIKQMMVKAAAFSKQQLDLRQKALKLTANSIYGCLGYTQSRFYAPHLASLITQKGREVLQSTRHRVEAELHLNVIYGDTDSIMVDTGIQDNLSVSSYTQALKMGTQVLNLINHPQSCLYLDLECIFSRLLLLKKKKYACIKVIDYTKRMFQREMKGLDIVRRDWCPLTKQMGASILSIMFDPDNTVDTVVQKIHDLLENINRDLLLCKFPLDAFVITKGLNKMPQYYPDAKSQPHVQVAKRLLEQGSPLHVGSEIQYVICKGENNQQSVACRAYTLQELSTMNLQVDIDWYKAVQILPPVVRLCEHLDGTDQQRLAKYLGINIRPTPVPSDTVRPPLIESNQLKTIDRDCLSHINRILHRVPDTTLLDEEVFVCPFCKRHNTPHQLLSDALCGSCQRQYPVPLIVNWLSRFTHSLLFKFGRFERSCAECQNIKTTRLLLASPYACPQAACSQFKHYNTMAATLPSSTLYELLRYLLSLFNQSFPPNCAGYQDIQSSTARIRYTLNHSFNLKPFLNLLNPL